MTCMLKNFMLGAVLHVPVRDVLRDDLRESFALYPHA